MTNEPEPNTRAGEALKPCERCGGKPMLCEPNYADEGGTMVVCEDCDLASDSFVLGEYGEGRAQAITAWNTRPLPQPSEVACDLSDFAPLTNAALRAHIAKLQADGDKLAGAATALRDDMLMRAEMHKHRNNGELVVEAGNGVWRRINQALTEWKDRA